MLVPPLHTPLPAAQFVIASTDGVCWEIADSCYENLNFRIPWLTWTMERWRDWKERGTEAASRR